MKIYTVNLTPEWSMRIEGTDIAIRRDTRQLSIRDKETIVANFNEWVCYTVEESDIEHEYQARIEELKKQNAKLERSNEHFRIELEKRNNRVLELKMSLNSVYGKRGICGDIQIGIINNVHLVCTLPADHPGWHSDDNGASWNFPS